MYTLKIKVTKEILQKSAMCGFIPSRGTLGSNCAFAVALREIFPEAYVGRTITFSNMDLYSKYSIAYAKSLLGHLNRVSIDNPSSRKEFGVIPHTTEMTEFINLFDTSDPAHRLAIPEKEFELEIPDYIIDKLDISEIQQVLANTEHLELVEN